MELKDLKTGMRIILRNGEESIVLKDVVTPYNEQADIYISISGGWMSSNDYNNDLTCKDDYKKYDIMKVYAQHEGRFIDGGILQKNAIKEMDLIWVREETKEMTISEIEKKLGYPIKIIKED